MVELLQPKLTKALVIHHQDDLRLDTLPVTAPSADEAIIRLSWGGICGSDMHYFAHGGSVLLF
ncbi:hypothetical protein [Neokomagataea tanensis]|uniref:hypothetical protein n=1 Tax=Neokomagataea tanensis TaxID=661191 RepID=UPI0030841529